MASVLTSPLPEIAIETPAEEAAAARTAHSVSARTQVRMGRAATMREGINWLTMGTIVVFHIGALAALFFFNWQRFLVMAILYVLAINVGIGMCYHRLLTHRGYHVPKWLEYVMTVCATLSLEGGPIFWVSTHRVHHQLSDQRRRSAHSPRRRMVGARRLAALRRGPALAD